MFYGILTRPGQGGMPFQTIDAPPTAQGEPLRVSPDATLVAFENQPDRLFAARLANTLGRILWYMDENILHPDDLQDAVKFDAYSDFQMWLQIVIGDD